MNLLLPILLTILAQPVTDPDRFNGYLILGYAVMWLIGIGYVISLAARQRNLQQDIRLMRQVLQDDEETAEK
jgi:hypothetical protein